MYEKWSLTPEKVEEAECLAPEDREKWFHGHLFADQDHELDATLGESAGSNEDGEEGGGGHAPEGDKNAEWEDEGQEAAREQGPEGEQKPTKIMTNREGWVPRGRTGNGRCSAGRCTGKRMTSGRTEHPSQTVPNGKERDLDLGGRRGGRRQWSRKAVKNALELELVKEILDAIRR